MMTVFNMASMTDVIFLLLIFFMVTSTFVFPSALEVNLPQSSEQTAVKPETRVWVDKDMNMYAAFGEEEPKALQPDQLMTFLQLAQQNNPEQFIALYADEEVPYGKIVDILDKGAKVKVKIVLATKPASVKYATPENVMTDDATTSANASATPSVQ